MESKTLELNMLSAKYLKDANLFFKMDVYAVVSLSGGSHQTQKAKTTVDKGCATKPRWDFPMKFTVNESDARRDLLTLEVNLFCKSSLLRDKQIGVVSVPAKELLEGAISARDNRLFQFRSYQVREPSGKRKGKLNISYRLVDKVAAPEAAPRPRPEKKKSIYGLLGDVLIGDEVINSKSRVL